MRQEVIDHLEKIIRMRSAQKKYFRTRAKGDLVESKQLETQVDIETPKLLETLKNK